jgi:MYXO-CTERM domain-containing protein
MRIAVHRIDWFVILVCVATAVGCSGGGCGGCFSLEPIPGGFPAAKRSPNAVQARVSQTGLAALTADPAKVIGPLLGGANNGVIAYPVPASCGGSPSICCPGGNPMANCGPINIDLNKYNGVAPLVIAPQQGASQLNVTVKARVKTQMDLPITYSGIDCTVGLDTTQGSTPYLQIDTQIKFVQDAMTGTTRAVAQNTAVTQLEGADVSLNGGFLCALGGAFIGLFIGTLEGAVATQLEDTINGATCKSCPSGNVAECGSTFATACTNGTCMEGSQCLAEIGIDGRARGSSLFGSFSPGTTGAIDLYEVAGGAAATSTNNSGISLGLLGGMEPGGAARDTCGPPSSEPAAVTIPVSTFFQGNVRPDNAQAFDVGFGIHKAQLAQFAFAGYNGGLLCLTIGHETVAQLTTDTISLVSRSLKNLVETSSPMAIGLRPQSPPTITLGPNTFTTDSMGNKVLDQPLLDIKFKALELDFFAEVDDQWIRVFTVVADVHLPVGLQVSGMGQLVPVIGNPSDAFTNISVKNSDAVTEDPATLAGLFPTLLSLVLPQLSNGLSPISLPNLGGLALSVKSITAVDDRDGDGVGDFLAIFANLVPVTSPRPVHTTVDITSIVDADPVIAKDPKRWAGARPPAVTLAFGGNQPDLEYSFRIDDGSWSAWSTNARPTIAPSVFFLPGVHHLDVRARQVDHPETIDLEPPRIELPMGVVSRAAAGPVPFHGSAGAAGCNCDAGGGPGGSALFALLIALIVLPTRRIRRRLGTAVWAAALACLPGCSCSSNPCGSKACMPGELAHAPGRWTSIAGDDKRVMVATYEPLLGDLVVADATDPAKLKYTVVDGVPDGVGPTYDPSTWRKGVDGAGPNVGAWTSIALSNHNARVAYQDRDALALKYAQEDGSHNWKSYVVDAGNGEQVGPFASLTIDGDGHPAIAYLGIGVDDGMGHRTTELRLARAGTTDPGESDWTISNIASAPGTCAGLCAGGQSCVAGAAPTDPESCITPTTDCTPACATGTVCSTGTCLTPIADPMVDDIPTGTGLFVSLVVLPDGRLAAAYYDRNRRALVLSVETAKGSSQFMENILDGNADGADRGMWSSAAVADDGTVHVAYQDALGDQLMYTTWNGMPGTPEVVDDGERMGDRPHPVGAAAAMYLVSGTPTIAYQDGMTADVYIATRGATWSATPFEMGPILDGFSIGATTGHGSPVLAWDARDPTQSPPNLVVVKAP